ncbi:hypothetical protein TCDM_12841 [Trypanosoma cruzi Dm28c]|uniref:Uncharacterized protein n=1 Tax=Trypanosoma cruzi Dm28c TaxID=1416333 RepID=V5AU97_TRYCR|nr:hypothetical protein TCDM_12841 [Trypanosoma cruzi Dm28c]
MAAKHFFHANKTRKHTIAQAAVTRSTRHIHRHNHRIHRKIDSGCAPSLPPLHGHGGRQQPPHATASMHYKRCIHIHRNVHLVCVWLCVPAATQNKDVGKEGAEYVEGRTKMYSGDA